MAGCAPHVGARPHASLAIECHAKEMAKGTADLASKRYFTRDQARAIATELKIDFKAPGCDLEQFRMGLGVELEHGPRDLETDVSADDPIVTGKIALAHLTEFPDFYTRLAAMEREAADPLSKKKQSRVRPSRRPSAAGVGALSRHCACRDDEPS